MSTARSCSSRSAVPSWRSTRATCWQQDAKLANDGQGFSRIALAYCTRTREEVDAVLAQVATAGARILKPAQDVFWGGYSGYFADPDGHAWEVAWNPDWTIEADGSVCLRKKG
jgi:uncharacterized protein